ncbi:MAG: hypothetical protein Roseis2KO_56330 [Roseivirga sp.]
MQEATQAANPAQVGATVSLSQDGRDNYANTIRQVLNAEFAEKGKGAFLFPLCVSFNSVRLCDIAS